jgi:hypothetical protein
VITCVIVSSDLFQGYNELVDLDDFRSIEQLCSYIQKKLMAHLCILNLDVLLKKICDSSFHIHGCKFIHELSGRQLVYVCECSTN